MIVIGDKSKEIDAVKAIKKERYNCFQLDSSIACLLSVGFKNVFE